MNLSLVLPSAVRWYWLAIWILVKFHVNDNVWQRNRVTGKSTEYSCLKFIRQHWLSLKIDRWTIYVRKQHGTKCPGEASCPIVWGVLPRGWGKTPHLQLFRISAVAHLLLIKMRNMHHGKHDKCLKIVSTPTCWRWHQCTGPFQPIKTTLWRIKR